MELKFKNRYLLESDREDAKQFKDKIMYFISEDMNDNLIFQYNRGYFHLNLPTYETALVPKGLCTFIDYDQQEHDKRVAATRARLEKEASNIQNELDVLNAVS